MNLDAVQKYLCSNSDSFWNWDLVEGSIQWNTGTTIAFGQEMASMLERFLERGLPRFDCALLVMAALRESWSCFNKNVEQDRLLLTSLNSALLNDTDSLHLIRQLDRLSTFPKEFSNTLSRRAMLVEMVLEPLSPRCHVSDAESVLSFLREHSDGFPHYVPKTTSMDEMSLRRIDLKALTLAIGRMEENKIHHRIATGLDAPFEVSPELVEETYSDAVEARELIETLLKDSENRSLGQLAKDLLAALYRPARLVPEETLHLEGYSDISNRGTLDRLLVSELAYDNETLAVRVANGEALYMRRDIPPSKVTIDRCILIDCGIRSWGTPRMFSAAVALALTAGASEKAKVCAWRSMNGDLERSYFVDESGLTEHLAALHSGLYPSATLDLFHDEVKQFDSGCEVYLVVSRDVWDDSDFRLSMSNSEFAKATLAIVDRVGTMEMMEWTRSAAKTTKRVEMSLVIEPDKTVTSLIVPQRLPRCFQCSPFPLRLSCPGAKFYPVDHGILLGRASEGRLVLWDSPEQGAISLQSSMPKGDLLASGLDEKRQTLWVVWGHPQNTKRWLLRFRMPDYSLIRQTQFDVQASPVEFSMQGTALLVTCPSSLEIRALDAEDGSLAGITHVTSNCHKNLFCDEDGNWFAVFFNGLGFDVSPISFGTKMDPKNIVHVMNTPMNDGFIGITIFGRMLHSKGIELDTDGIEIPTVVAGSTVVAGQTVVRGSLRTIGNNRWVGGSTDKRNFIFEITDEGKLENRLSDNPIALVWGKPSASIIGPYRNRFHGIGLNQGNVVMIRNRHMLTLQVEGLQTGFWRWVAKTVEPSTKIQGVASFTYNKELTQEMGHRMEFARAGNVEAILDGRGLLHLRSLDSTLAELTMVIKEGITSGWTSDGCWFGSSFHCGTHPLTTASAIDRDVLQPILRGWQS